MSFDYGSYISSKATAYETPATTTASKDLDKNAFLKLLVAQLGHQDPLNPMEDKEFTAQLAQFSSLEQLNNINEGIQSLINGTTRQEMLTAVSFIGKSVRAEGSVVSKGEDAISTVYLTIPEAVQHIYVNIFDENGNVVRTEDLGAAGQGTKEYVWDGKDWRGTELADGVYSISVAAEGATGQPVFIGTEVSGVVSGVQSYNGHHYLRLKDGRIVDMLDITEVVNPEPTQAEGDTAAAASGATSGSNSSSSGITTNGSQPGA